MADSVTPVTTPVTDDREQEHESDSKTSRYLRPDELLRKWSIALTNAAADGGLLGAMSRFGYDEKRLAEGVALHERVTDLFAKQKKEYGEQLEASAAMSAAFDKANTSYMRSIKIARIAFEKDPNAVAALLLSGARSKVVSTWTRQADTFYRNLISNPDFIGKMAYYGYSVDMLKSELELVQEVVAADARHKKERGESQEATAVRNEALAELEGWMSRFYRIAKIACSGESQWLEKIGIKE